MHRFLRRCLTRTPVLGLLMAALVFRALIPAGFMPAVGATGQLAMAMCPGVAGVAPGAGKHAYVGLTGGNAERAANISFGGAPDNRIPADHDHDQDMASCGFAGTAYAPQLALPHFASVSTAQVFTFRRDSLDCDCPSIVRAQSPRAPPTPLSA